MNRALHCGQTAMYRHTARVSTYRVIQWGRSMFRDVILSAIVRKKFVQTNKQTDKCLILNG